jgi:ABC-type bacteriocin/lantibiotic exporter with double-glycine peptidase domain
MLACQQALAPVVICDRTNPTTTDDLLRLGIRGQGAGAIKAVLWLLIAAIASLAPIALAGVIVGQIIPTADRSRLVIVTIAALFLASAAAVSTLVAGQHLSALRTRFDRTTSLAGWHRLMSLPAPFFGLWTVGELTARASTIPLVRQVFGTSAMLGIGGAIAGLVALPTLLAAGVSTTVAVGLVLAAAIAATAMIARAQYRRVRTINDASNRASGILLPMIFGATHLRIADATDRAYERWVDRLGDQLRAQLLQPQIWLGAISVALPTATITVVAALFVIDPSIDQSVFLAAVAASVALSSSISVIISLVPAGAEARAGLDQIGPILDAVPESSGNQRVVGELTGQLDLDEISFRYSEDGPLIIDRVSFSASPGEFVALVGGSGAGKSTLIRLLLGFELPTSGAIAYDGFDLSEIDPLGIRRQIATVLQNARLLPGSLADNITSGRPASQDDIWAALEAVGFADDVRRLPMGLQTVISDQGGGLSGGQRQRVLLARALYGRPRLLLLDEATSALDNVTQAMVTESINGLGITRLVIAHRLSTIEQADIIHVLEHGRIVETGSYDELIEANGTFAGLVARQRL